MSKRLLWSQYLGFVAVGLVCTVIGSLLPTIRTEISMNYTQAGYILSGISLGMILTVLFSGYLSDKIGEKPFLIVGGIILTSGLLGCMVSSSYKMLLTWVIISGVGYGIYEVGINALCADLSDEDNIGSAMNLLHFFFGLGGIIAPIFATLCIKYLNSWRVAFGVIAVVPIIVSIMLASVKLEKHSNENTKKHKSTFNEFISPYKNSFVWLAGLFCFFYIGIEVSTFGWLPEYWQSLSSEGLIPASLIPTIFWISLTSGRLISGKLADKFGLSRFITFGCICSMVLIFIWTLLPFKTGTFIIVFLIGFFLSGLFPTAMALGTSHFPDGRSGEIVAFISVFASLGGFIIPSTIGRLSDSFGISKIPLIMFVLSVVITIVSFVWKLSSKNIAHNVNMKG